MSVVIFHPSTAPFVQQAARALLEADLLARFYTTVRDDPTSLWQRAACRITETLGRDLRRQLRRRAVTEIPPAFVTSFPIRELIRLAVGAVDRGGRATDLVWEWAEPGFDRAVARQLRAGVRGVYGFEHSSLATFNAARAAGLRTIYDVPAPEPEFVHALLDREMQAFPELRTPYHRHTQAREARRTARRRAEWNAADVVIAASTFTKRSYVDAGLDGSKVRVIPYGAPDSAPREVALPRAATDRPLEILWAGTFGIRKGAHYLLDAWRRHGLGAHARLRIHGAVAVPDRLLHPLPPGVHLGGSIPRAELYRAYAQADVLVFPTLCDGFGLVVTEAFSQGLPVITTQNAGAADLVRHTENGLIVPAGDADALAEAVVWCLDHRTQLRAMRESALATAERHPWSGYRAALGQTVREVLP